MVVRSGFEVQLVSADTKVPFKEHEKDGKIYVEAEPDAEYFIAIRRTSLEGLPVILSSYRVDGKKLGYRRWHESVRSDPIYQGLFSRIDGKGMNTALRFIKPSMAKDGDKGYAENTGKVTISLYEGILEGSEPITDVVSKFEPARKANPACAKAGKKKFLLSSPGNTIVQTPNHFKTIHCYTAGARVDRITLNYCSALGMIEAGVFPKPDLWTLERMKHPAPAGQLTAKFKRMRHPTEEKSIEVVDLTNEKELPKFTW